MEQIRCDDDAVHCQLLPLSVAVDDDSRLIAYRLQAFTGIDGHALGSQSFLVTPAY